MRFKRGKEYRKGTKRLVKRFAFIPMEVEHKEIEFVWLECYYSVETYTETLGWLSLNSNYTIDTSLDVLYLEHQPSGEDLCSNWSCHHQFNK